MILHDFDLYVILFEIPMNLFVVHVTSYGGPNIATHIEKVVGISNSKIGAVVGSQKQQTKDNVSIGLSLNQQLVGKT